MWEYKMLQCKLKTKGFLGLQWELDALQGEFNELGRQGWELVCIQYPTIRGWGRGRCFATLKRPR